MTFDRDRNRLTLVICPPYHVQYVPHKIAYPSETISIFRPITHKYRNFRFPFSRFFLAVFRFARRKENCFLLLRGLAIEACVPSFFLLGGVVVGPHLRGREAAEGKRSLSICFLWGDRLFHIFSLVFARWAGGPCATPLFLFPVLSARVFRCPPAFLSATLLSLLKPRKRALF